ncbi:heterokaryon incompatibility protein-domain-containing protein [Xylaria telfairii]|nr:heterokaryon incompatibility protein-domain-containing protein [Xylaria telfairii]
MPEPPLRFTYTALSAGEIRLLFSSVQQDRLVWTLKAVQLRHEGSQAPIAFDALSYTWGDQGLTFPFICNNQELRIHKNLRDALPYLARRRSTLPIWIDAICIDQSNSVEKFSQIRMMHSIYRQATQTWIWFGCGADYIKEAIKLLPEVGRIGEELETQKRKSGNEFTKDSTTLPSASSPIWKPVRKLTQNKWFDRLWVVQEAALSKRIRVLYENDEIDWEVLEKAVYHGWNIYSNPTHQSVFKDDFPIDFTNDTVFIVRKLVQSPDVKAPWSNNLLSFLRITADMSQCFDPRDRVFGHLGLITEDQLHQLGLDDGMPLEELYMRLTHFLLSNGSQSYQNWWDILQIATATDKMPGLPSWCPDYHTWGQRPYGIRNTEEPVYLREWRYYRAARATSYSQPSTNFRELKVRGKIFDLVKRTYPIIPDVFAVVESETSSPEELQQIIIAFRDWERTLATDVLGLASSNLPDDPTSELGLHDKHRLKVTVDGYWRTLFGNIPKDGDYIINYESFRSFRSILNQFALQESGVEDLFIRMPNFKVLRTMTRTLKGRRLFCTVHGGFGFGPKGTQVNDQVCVLNNALTTHLLRRSSKTKRRKTFKLIGDAYFHGMMDGQIESLGLEEQDIVLV